MTHSKFGGSIPISDLGGFYVFTPPPSDGPPTHEQIFELCLSLIEDNKALEAKLEAKDDRLKGAAEERETLRDVIRRLSAPPDPVLGEYADAGRQMKAFSDR